MLLYAGLQLVLLLRFAVAGGAHVQDVQGGSNDDVAVATFLEERADWNPLCLYTFGNPQIGSASGIADRVGNDTCPFGALRPDDELVTSLNRETTFNQIGVSLAADPGGDSTRVQLGSIDTVSAREFFTAAAVGATDEAKVIRGGVTFELVLRRRTQRNQSMTLFSIANEFDSCVDPGFRLDLNEHQALVFIYFLPVLEEEATASVEACYEQRLFSVDTSAACLLPPLAEPVEDTPPVHLTVTLDPSSETGLWKTDFYMSYTSPETKTRVDCVVHDEQHPPTKMLLNSLVEGRYRLFIGNSPRNVSSPRERRQLAPSREFRALGSNTTALNATERLRLTIKKKLMNIKGPRLPKAMRIFGDNSFTLSVLGVTFPPLNEDTPLAYLRSKLEDFKEKYGDQIVDYLVRLAEHNTDRTVVVQKTSRQKGDLLDQLGQGGKNGDDEFSRAELFQGADGATFDLFHFAIYRHVVSEEQVATISRHWLLPSRRFPARRQTLHILEDSTTLLDLTVLLSVFDDLRLELHGVPEFGRLLLFPNRTVVTLANIDVFRGLPLEQQRRIFFQPDADQNNDNLPLPNSVAFSRRMQPYASVMFGIAESLAGRSVNMSEEAQVDIFVDAVNDAPRPRAYDREICVEKDVLVQINLEGDDPDGSPSDIPKSEATDVDGFVPSFTYSDPVMSTLREPQLVQVVRLPLFGKLFECKSSCSEVVRMQGTNLESLEPFRVHRSFTEKVNNTVSTGLAYIFRGWGQSAKEPEASSVDELWYRLGDGDPGVFSDIAKVKFVLATNGNSDSEVGTQVARANTLAVLDLQEDSLHLVNLVELEPLVVVFDSKTRYQVTTLPSHGGLYQYKRSSNATADTTDARSGDHTKLAGNVSLAYVGRRIMKVPSVVTDPLGSIMYAPNRDYFNVQVDTPFVRVSAPDFFEYEVVNISQKDNDPEVSLTTVGDAARFDNSSSTRRILLNVGSDSDALSVLPPVTFHTNLTRGNSVSVPIAFEDPDTTAADALYHVSFESTDGVSEFELGFAITDDDVMMGCSFERPCTLLRSTNGGSMNTSSGHGIKEYQLQFQVATQLYDASHVDVTGTRTALSTALKALVFRDLVMPSSSGERTAEFTMRLKRSKDEDGNEVETVFTIEFAASNPDDSTTGDDLLSTVTYPLSQYGWTLLFLAVGWVVLANASCCSTSFCFCCCCCSKARKKQWARFERQRKEFLAQVAQNDHEYSALLMDVANLLLEPDLIVSVSLLQSCAPKHPFRNTRTTKQVRLMQAFCLRSLLPLLESERQGTRFVFRLVAAEFANQTSSAHCAGEVVPLRGFLARSSTASTALAYFCRRIGTKWLAYLMGFEGSDITERLMGSVGALRGALLQRMEAHLEDLPAEIVILSRACADLFQSSDQDGSRNDSKRLASVHLVFFGHFLGPALLFPDEDVLGFAASSNQRRALRGVANVLARIGTELQSENVGVGLVRERRTNVGSTETSSRELRHGDSSDSLLSGVEDVQDAELEAQHQAKYTNVLLAIDRSSSVTSSYIPSEDRAEPDCDLMGMCLMNVHSLLDSRFPEFRRQYEQTRAGVLEANEEHEQRRVARLMCLQRTLSFPIATVDVLVEHARLELESDQLLWHGFSLQEWEARASLQRSKKTSAVLSTQCAPETGEECADAVTRSVLTLHTDGVLQYEEQQSPGV